MIIQLIEVIKYRKHFICTL